MASSSLEKFSFVCHLFIFPFGLLFLLWAVVPEPILERTVYVRENDLETVPNACVCTMLAGLGK
jgi:hypothetical protein